MKALLKLSAVLSVCVFLNGLTVLAADTPKPNSHLRDTSEEIKLSLRLISDKTGELTNEVSADSPGRLTATLTDEKGEPVSNRAIRFSISQNLGLLQPETGSTDENGETNAYLLAGSIPGDGVVTATFDEQSVSLTFTTLGDQPKSMSIYLRLTDHLTGDETDTIDTASPGRLEAALRDETGNPVPDKEITFSTTLGTLDPATGKVSTNSKGKADIQLMAVPNSGAGTVTAAYGNYSATLDFTSLGDVKLLLQLTDMKTGDMTDIITADSSGRLTATLTDAQNKALPNQIITFDTTMGQFYPPGGTATTNKKGKASVILLAGSKQGQGSATATFRDYATNISFTANPPKDINLSIRLTNEATGYETGAIHADSPGRVEVALTDADGAPLANRIVTFSTTLGDFHPTADGLTDRTGQATVLLSTGSEKGEDEVVTATFGEYSAELTFAAVGDEGMKLSLRLVNDATGEVTDKVSNDLPGRVEATLTYQSGTPVRDQLITFARKPDLGLFDPESGTAKTDEKGLAKVILSAGRYPGSAEVTATDGNYSATIPFETLGDQKKVPTISLQLISTETGEATDTISAASPGHLIATVTEAPVADQEIMFSVTAGTLDGAGTMVSIGRTNANGQATAVIFAGWTPGAGVAAAIFGDISATQDFSTAGDQPKPPDAPEGDDSETGSEGDQPKSEKPSETTIRSVAGTLKYAIIYLRIITGTESGTAHGTTYDINGDQRIGMEEVIYTLQTASGMRP